MNKLEECALCSENKEIHRKITLADNEGILVDSAVYCKDCWLTVRVLIEELTNMTDLPAFEEE